VIPARRQMVVLQVTLSVDADKAEKLADFEGWSSFDGDYESPMSGLAICGEHLVWSLARSAMDQWSETLGSHILAADVVVSDPVDESHSIL
jgi:hypothetical protein